MKGKLIKKIAHQYYFKNIESGEQFTFTHRKKLNIKLGQIIDFDKKENDKKENGKKEENN